ncbi:gluconokinase [Prauserella endophytica]|uniref:Gluconokinase n=1 Tax=Prauserella endophytica TaxID=1592324 RepID=A0ABY2S4Y3_9PSEU|nr:gluconokinase [Prauserella endophytica]TKG70918.1 gluconokinase [Prauserella endophytica]
MSTAGSLVVMGVSGCGKTTVGRLLAEELRAGFVDADDLHSDEARAKMAAGVPLTDADREPWLARVASRVAANAARGRRLVVACSALRRRYRDALRAGAGVPLEFVHLHGDASLIASRMADREGHFMPADLLPSQLATLEPLEADEPGSTIDIAGDPPDIVSEITGRLAPRAAGLANGGKRFADRGVHRNHC